MNVMGGRIRRDIVNGAQLPRFINKPISIIGSVVKVSDLTFTIRTTDNENILINLQQPLDKPISGFVEVHGISQGKSVRADEIITFTNEKFDTKSHNTLCNLLYTVPNLWKVK